MSHTHPGQSETLLEEACSICAVDASRIRKYWERLTQAIELVESVHQHLRRKNFPSSAVRLIVHCRKYETSKEKWKRALIHVAAAQYVVHNPDLPFGNTVLERVLGVLPDAVSSLLGQFSKAEQHAQLFMDCVTQFRQIMLRNDKAVSSPLSPVRVPFALCVIEKDTKEHSPSDEHKGAGRIAWLKLEAIPLVDDTASTGLTGGLLAGRHPDNVLGPSVGKNFQQSMSDAFTAAMHLAGVVGADTRYTYRGWWSIETRGDEAIEGRSASGAAARGWYSYLKGEKPDKGVVVMAEIQDDRVQEGVLDGVLYVREKAEAVVNARNYDPLEPFDTIVVASAENWEKAKDTVDKLNTSGKIRVGVPEELLRPSANTKSQF